MIFIGWYTQDPAASKIAIRYSAYLFNLHKRAILFKRHIIFAINLTIKSFRPPTDQLDRDFVGQAREINVRSVKFSNLDVNHRAKGYVCNDDPKSSWYKENLLLVWYWGVNDFRRRPLQRWGWRVLVRVESLVTRICLTQRHFHAKSWMQSNIPAKNWTTEKLFMLSLAKKL